MNKKNFYIPQVEKEEKKVIEEVKETPKAEPQEHLEGFVSPIYGKNVKDESYLPGEGYRSSIRQYDSFRKKEDRIDPNDYKEYIIHTDHPKPNFDEPLTKNNEQTIRSDGAIIPNNQSSQNDSKPIYQEKMTVQSNEVKQQEDEYVPPLARIEETEFRPVAPKVEEYIGKQQTFPKKLERNVSLEFNERNEEQNIDNNINQFNQNNQEDENIEETPIITKTGRVNLEPRKTEQVKPVGKKKGKYNPPSISLLRRKPKDQIDDMSDVQKQRDIIDETMRQFSIGGHVTHFTKGPTVTQFEVQLNPGVRYAKMSQIQENLQGNLEATSLRIQTPIPGKAAVGLEVPNVKREMVYFGDILDNKEFLNDGNPMNVVLGIDIAGEPVYLNLSSMPHGLIAGTTGSGKSVCINAIISTILYKAHPDDVKLVLVDPKRVEFTKFANIPHLATPIITEPKLATASLKWAVEEMESRYRLFASLGVSKYSEYLEYEQQDPTIKHIPYIVIIIDELADLIVTSGPEVEESILRLTQKARAAAIHLIVATQRPSVNIISGTIKTNIPTRIAFRVQKQVDSQIILDHGGAEKLLGNGDMLYCDETGNERRIQGAFISGMEIKNIVTEIQDTYDAEYLFTEEDLTSRSIGGDGSNDALNDEIFEQIATYVVENQTASINALQKTFRCGFNRIQAIIQKLEELGVVSGSLGNKAREVLVDMDGLERILESL